MADETNAPETSSDASDPDESLGEPGLKALQAEREARRRLEAQIKDLEPLAEKAREVEEAQKSEAQRVAEQIQALKAEAETARNETLRLRVAATTGLPALLAERLQGSTEEEMLTDARKLADLLKPSLPRKPVTDLTPGTASANPAPTTDPNEWLRRMVSGKRAN